MFRKLRGIERDQNRSEVIGRSESTGVESRVDFEAVTVGRRVRRVSSSLPSSSCLASVVREDGDRWASRSSSQSSQVDSGSRFRQSVHRRRHQEGDRREPAVKTVRRQP